MAKTLSDKLSACVVTFGGLGKLPLCPGTWATLGAVGIHALAAHFDRLYLLPIFAVMFCIACLVYGPWAEKYYGRKDPGVFVIDEVAGYLFAVSLLPSFPPVPVAVSVFVLFRVFDIFKPFPAGVSQKLRGGLGILADDLIAGAYAALLTWPVLRLIL